MAKSPSDPKAASECACTIWPVELARQRRDSHLLDVLYDAGLISRSKAGRVVTVRIRPEPMREAMAWLRRYERFWSKSLDRLAAYAESKEAEARKKRR